MSTYEELKKKMADLGGYMKLSDDERELYSKLKKEHEEGSKPTPQTFKKKEGWEEAPKEVSGNKKAKLRLYQEDAKSPKGLIIRADFLKNVWDEETHKHDKLIYEIEVLYDDDQTKVYEIPAEDFVKINQTEEVELIDVDRKRLRKVIGKVGIPMRDKDGYPIIRVDAGGYGSAQGTVGEVEQDVIRYEEIFTIKRPNGQIYVVHSDHLNA